MKTNHQDDIKVIDKLIDRARIAQHEYELKGSQKLFDLATQSVAWVVMESERNKFLSELAVSETKLGNVQDKIKKNHNKTLGLMRDLKEKKTFGLISEDTNLSLV